MPGADRFLPAQQALGLTAFRPGDFATARTHLEQSVAVYDPSIHSPEHSQVMYGQDPGVLGLSFLAWSLWYLGYPDQALQRSQEVQNLARELGHPLSLVFALRFSTAVYRLRREGQIAQARAEAVIALSGEQGFPFFRAGGTFLRGWALAEQGQVEEGIAEMQAGLSIWREIGITQLGQLSLLLAEAYGKAGRVQDGLDILTQATAEMGESNEHWWQGEMLRVRGELLLALGSNTQKVLQANGREAEACFQKAIEAARSQGAKSLELRAALSLSRLWQQEDKHEDAQQLLSDIYTWFSEGLDTADLQAAKALLAQLEPVQA